MGSRVVAPVHIKGHVVWVSVVGVGASPDACCTPAVATLLGSVTALQTSSLSQPHADGWCSSIIPVGQSACVIQGPDYCVLYVCSSLGCVTCLGAAQALYASPQTNTLPGGTPVVPDIPAVFVLWFACVTRPVEGTPCTGCSSDVPPVPAAVGPGRVS